jgi:outer membrane protein insertion porin family
MWGKKVAAIELQCDAVMSLSEFRPQVTQRVGEPLDRDKVSESLKNLFATGRFRDLRSEAEPKGDGVVLIFVARAQYFSGGVSVEGAPKNLEEQGLIMATHLRLGQPLTDEGLRTAEQRLSESLIENGYYQAKITHQVVPDSATEEAQIIFTIESGEQAKLSEINFEGETVVPPKKLESVAGWRIGRPLTSAKLEKGLSKIRQFLVKRNYLQATTVVLGRNYDSSSNTEKLGVQIDAGPQIKIHVRGAHVSTSKQKEILPMYTEGVTDDYAVLQGQKSLEDYLQRKGYFSASVVGKRSVDAKTQEVDITYEVQAGSLGVFEGYAIEGNHALTIEELEAVLTLQRSGFFHDRGIFSQQMLARDTKALSELYHAAGYLEAKVTPRLDTRYQEKDDHLFVTFRIDEGVLARVSSISVRGLDASTERDIQNLLQTKVGGPYAPQRILSDREKIRSYFGNRGYSHAAVEFKSTPGPAEHEFQVGFEIDPGSQEHIHQVLLMGNRHTRDGIIQRELQFAPGEPLNQANLLESQRRLYDLGVFNQVQISPQDPQGLAVSKTVLVNVEEAKRWTLGYGGGIEVQRLGSNQPRGDFKASPRLSLDVTRLNVGGRAQSVAFHGRLSSLDKGASITYYIPRFPTRPDIHVRLGALYDRSSDVLTFTSKRAETSISLEKTYSATTLLVGRFNFRNVKALDLSDRISEQQIPLASRAARIAMLGLTYINDHRDNPVDATKGSFSIADGGVSWSGLGSEANFFRVSGENSTFYRLGRHLIFARDTRVSIESPYGGLRRVVTQDANGVMQINFTHDIPLPERFFMGGSESHRGFSINQAGPRDLEKGFPIGGNALFLNSLELRMPFAEDRLGFVLFHDSGNVFSSVRKMRLLKFKQSSPTDFDYNVNAVGIGLRYKTPVGPLRIDVGYNLNPPRFQVVDSNTGNIGVLRLSNFQFFLGIGQSF